MMMMILTFPSRRDSKLVTVNATKYVDIFADLANVSVTHNASLDLKFVSLCILYHLESENLELVSSLGLAFFLSPPKQNEVKLLVVIISIFEQISK